MDRRKSHTQMLDELAEMSRAVARSLRAHAASTADAGAGARMARLAAEMERDVVLTLRLKTALAAERRRRDFGVMSLRSACPPTPTRH